MKHRLVTVIAIALASITTGAEMTATGILHKADQVESAPKDQTYTMSMVLVDKQGHRKEREAKMMQKGDSMRLLKFLSPGDIKGAGILTLPGDVIYFYMPAFNNTRRIAAHVKNQSFMGTDFTYDDFGSITYGEDYNAVGVREQDAHYVLELTPKKEADKEYSKLLLWVDMSNFYKVKTEYYGKSGELLKVMERENIRKIGEYWVAHTMTMKDVKKQHRTILQLTNVEIDKDLGDELFSQRYLQRN
ncbi:MAG: outer membrane lipoprotein-sorting protein [Anaerolineales bacterium]|nr:outer membrane lipoprotein-sorting protein [Anaerolineales bacterium]